MRPMVERKSLIFGALILVGVVSAPLVPALAIGFQQDPQKNEVKSPEDIKAEEAFTRNCVKCHPVDRIAGSRRTRTQWEEVMTTMQTARGAVITGRGLGRHSDLSGETLRPGERESRDRRRPGRGAGRHP